MDSSGEEADEPLATTRTRNGPGIKQIFSGVVHQCSATRVEDMGGIA